MQILLESLFFSFSFLSYISLFFLKIVRLDSLAVWLHGKVEFNPIHDVEDSHLRCLEDSSRLGTSQRTAGCYQGKFLSVAYFCENGEGYIAKID